MAAPASTRRSVTADEFTVMSMTDDRLYELVRGRVVREKGYTRPIHGRLESRMAHLLESWMEERNDGGAVMTNSSFVVATDPDTVRRPDVAYISAERIPESRYGPAIWRLGPDVVVEVTSPSNTWTDIQERVTDYFSAGTRLVWVVDPPTRTVTVYRQDVRAQRLGTNAELEGEDALPGFRVRLDRLFHL